MVREGDPDTGQERKSLSSGLKGSTDHRNFQSVPPLYASLQRIWSWIDKDTELSKSQDLPKTLGDRFPWWEKLVSLIQKREQKTLCLT